MIRVLADRWLDVEEHAPSEPIQGIVFDLDDTLLHQKLWIAGKLQAAAESLPQLIPDREAFLLRALQSVEEGPRDALIDEQAERLGLRPEGRDQLLEAYRAAVPERSVLFPDVVPTLESLRRAGLKLGLLTDNPPASQRQKVKVCGLARWFEAIVYSQELGAEKPDGRGFAACAEGLGLPVERLGFVGDNPYRDALGAHSAGYGRVYVVRRHGTFYNFEASLLGALPGGSRFKLLDDLQQLLCDVAELRRSV
jgi:HAD superfamily hydrolase (TIGR01549 family)